MKLRKVIVKTYFWFGKMSFDINYILIIEEGIKLFYAFINRKYEKYFKGFKKPIGVDCV